MMENVTVLQCAVGKAPQASNIYTVTPVQLFLLRKRSILYTGRPKYNVPKIGHKRNIYEAETAARGKQCMQLLVIENSIFTSYTYND
jgi:hypothetical protein